MPFLVNLIHYFLPHNVSSLSSPTPKLSSHCLYGKGVRIQLLGQVMFSETLWRP